MIPYKVMLKCSVTCHCKEIFSDKINKPPVPLKSALSKMPNLIMSFNFLINALLFILLLLLFTKY